MLAEHPELAAAVVDFGLSDGDGFPLFTRLQQRNIPFVLHTGHAGIGHGTGAAAVVQKPAAPTDVVRTVASILKQAA